jgi:hypothetical protein
MKLFKVIVVFLFIPLIGCKNPSSSLRPITEEDYYNFIRSMDTNIHSNGLLENEADNDSTVIQNLLLDKNFQIARDSLFSKDDIEYMKQQARTHHTIFWSQKKLPSIKMISRAKLDSVFKTDGDGWNSFYKNCGSGYYSYSIPLFSLDKTKCIVYYSDASGFLAASGNIFICVKGKAGNWFVFKSRMTWVS